MIQMVMVFQDGVEDANQDGVYDVGEMNPLAGDTDGDGISRWQ